MLYLIYSVWRSPETNKGRRDKEADFSERGKRGDGRGDGGGGAAGEWY